MRSIYIERGVVTFHNNRVRYPLSIMESNEDGQTCSVTSDLLQPFISLCSQVSIMLVCKTTVQASHGFQKGVHFGREKFDSKSKPFTDETFIWSWSTGKTSPYPFNAS